MRNHPQTVETHILWAVLTGDTDRAAQLLQTMGVGELQAFDLAVDRLSDLIVERLSE